LRSYINRFNEELSERLKGVLTVLMSYMLPGFHGRNKMRGRKETTGISQTAHSRTACQTQWTLQATSYCWGEIVFFHTKCPPVLAVELSMNIPPTAETVQV